MCFCLTRELLAGYLSTVSASSSWYASMPGGHHGKISTPPSKWLQEFWTNGCRATERSSRVCHRRLSSPALILPLPNRCSRHVQVYTDGMLPVIVIPVIFVYRVEDCQKCPKEDIEDIFYTILSCTRFLIKSCTQYQGIPRFSQTTSLT